MRTHIYNKMTAGEISSYLASGRDAIFVAVGVTEIHGEMPVNVETIRAEGFALAMAQKCGALALTNLPYFYPGGTVIGDPTVHTTIRDGYHYLWKILKSLVDQGFKKIFLIPGHGGIALICTALIRDFFEAFHIHPVMISTMAIFKHPNGKGAFGDLTSFEITNCGAYRIMGMEEDLPIQPDFAGDTGEKIPDEPIMHAFAWKVRSLGGVAALAYSDTRMHGGGLVFHSEAERDEICAKGEKWIRDSVDAIDLDGLLAAVGDYQAYVLRVCEKFPRFNKLP